MELINGTNGLEILPNVINLLRGINVKGAINCGIRFCLYDCSASTQLPSHFGRGEGAHNAGVWIHSFDIFLYFKKP